MIQTAFWALLSHWVRHPGQLVTLVVGLSLATALWSGVQAINAEAQSSYAQAAASLGQNELENLRDPNGDIAQATYITLRRAGWAVSPVLEGRAIFGETRVKLLGIDPVTAPLAAQPVDLSAPDQLVQFIAGRIGFAHPDTLAKLDRQFLPIRVAPVASLARGQIVVDIGVAQRLLKRPETLTRLIVSPNQNIGLPQIKSLVPELVHAAPETRSEVASLTDSFHLNLTAFGMLAFTVGLFIVHSAIGLAFEQRRAIFRTLRALGVPGRTLVWLLLVEVVLLALLSGGFGVLLGYLIAATLLPDVAATLQGLYGAEVPSALSLRPIWWISGLSIATLGALLAAAQSLWRVSRLPVLAVAQPGAWLRAMQKGLGWQAILSVMCFFIAAFVISVFDGLLAGFVMLACLLLGSALALPVILALALKVSASISKRPLTHWFWADTRQQLPGLSLALMALMLALATNIGVGTMVSSFRQTFVGWLDQRLMSEFYVTARSEQEAALLRPVLEDAADAVLPIWRHDTTFGAAPADIYAIADHDTYRNHWPLLVQTPAVWQQLAAGEGVLINEQFWRRAGHKLGDFIDLSPQLSLPLVGVYSDYGNPKAQAMVGEQTFIKNFPEAPRLGFALRLDPEKIPKLKAKLSEQFGLPNGVMIDQSSIKEFSLSVFERTFAVSGALNVLTLGVAGFAMLTSLLTLATMRLPQIAPVWALGLDRSRIAKLELLRAAILATMTSVIAIPVGLMLAWSLLAVVNVEAFGWRLPMFLYPGQWGLLALLALVAALLASLLPVLRLARTTPTDLLKVFAHER